MQPALQKVMESSQTPPRYRYCKDQEENMQKVSKDSFSPTWSRWACYLSWLHGCKNSKRNKNKSAIAGRHLLFNLIKYKWSWAEWKTKIVHRKIFIAEPCPGARKHSEIPASRPMGLFAASSRVTGDAASAQTGGFWHGDTRLFLGTQKNKWSWERSSPWPVSPRACLGQANPRSTCPCRGTPNAWMGEQGSRRCCPVRQAGTARGGSYIIPLKLQKQAKCNYRPNWSSARTSGLTVLLLWEVPQDFSNDHKWWSRPQFHISFGR